MRRGERTIEIAAQWAGTQRSVRKAYRTYWSGMSSPTDPAQLVRVVVPRQLSRPLRTFYFIYRLRETDELLGLKLWAGQWAGEWHLAEISPQAQTESTGWIRGWMDDRIDIKEERGLVRLQELLTSALSDKCQDPLERHLIALALSDQLYQFFKVYMNGALERV